MKVPWLPSLLALAAGTAVCAPVRASAVERFGQSGQVVPSGFLLVRSIANDDGRDDWIVRAGPTVLWLYKQDVAFGGGIFAQRFSEGPFKGSQNGFDLQMAFNLPLGESLSLLLNVSAGPSWSSTEVAEGTCTRSCSPIAGRFATSRLNLGAFVPLLFHVAPHFYLGFGPRASKEVLVNISLNGGPSQPGVADTRLGMASVVGGWF